MAEAVPLGCQNKGERVIGDQPEGDGAKRLISGESEALSPSILFPIITTLITIESKADCIDSVAYATHAVGDPSGGRSEGESCI